MKIDDSVESLVHCLIHSLSPEWVVRAARDRHGIASDNSGCGVNYYDPNDPASPNNRPGQVRLYYFWGRRHGGHEAVKSEDEYLRVLANTLRADSATGAADQINEIRKNSRAL
jgi:hypothetical protein